MAFLVRDFIHTTPANDNRPVRKIRKGAATVFVDRETGDLIAGYSYNTCLYTIAASADYPAGRLYVNDTRYGITSTGHASWLAQFIPEQFKDRWLPTGEFYEWGSAVRECATPLAGHPADAIDVQRGASAADLIAICNGGVRGDDAPYHASTTFAPPDGVYFCAYFIANAEWLQRDLSAYHRGMLWNAQRIEAALAYNEWTGVDPCGCEPCNKTFGPAAA